MEFLITHLSILVVSASSVKMFKFASTPQNNSPLKTESLDIILPCYNPPENWADNAVFNFEALEKELSLNLGIVIVNDGSTMDLKDDFDLLKSRLSNLILIDEKRNSGKGSALRKGVAHSKADAVLLTDCDFPYQEESMLEVIACLKSGQADIVAGVRNQEYYTHVPWFRKALSKIYRRLLKRLIKLNITDTQCGLKGMNRKAISLFISTTTNRYLFDLEFLAMASRQGVLTIKPVLVNLKTGVTFSRMSPVVLITELINFFKIMLKT